MSKKEQSNPIRVKLEFPKNKTEHWDCDNVEQLGTAIREEYERNGRLPVAIKVRKEASHA